MVKLVVLDGVELSELMVFFLLAFGVDNRVSCSMATGEVALEVFVDELESLGRISSRLISSKRLLVVGLLETGLRVVGFAFFLRLRRWLLLGCSLKIGGRPVCFTFSLCLPLRAFEAIFFFLTWSSLGWLLV